MEQLLKKYLNDPLGQIIYAGVGNASFLDWLLALQFDSIHLIEPISSVSSRLSKKYAADNVTITNIAISDLSGEADFTLMQPEKYSSLKQNINLNTILKNSAKKAQHTIKTQSLSELIQKSNLQPECNNTLILSINGLERECLNSVTEEDLTRFSTLFVQIENKGIYSEEDNLDGKLKALLKTKGFYFEETYTEAIFTNLFFKRDDSTIAKIYSLNNELNELKSALSAHIQQKAALTEENVSQKNELNKLIVKHETAQAERELAQTALAETKKALEESHNQLSNQQVALDEQKALLAERTKQRDEQTEYHQKNKQWAESLKAQLEQAKTEQENLKTEQEKNQAERELAQTALAETKKALEESRNKLTNQQVALDEHKALLAERTKQRDEQTEYHQKNKQWAESLKAQLEQAKTEQENLKTEQEKNQSERELAQTALAETKKALEESHNKLSNQQVALDEQKAQLAEQTRQYEEHVNLQQKNKLQIEAMDKTIQGLRSDLSLSNERSKSAYQTLSLNTKLMTKLEMDNESLRDKLLSYKNEEKELKSLIRELHEKLLLASEFYQQVQKNYPELIKNDF